ncbi:hypothetical protein DBA29_05185 [Xenophilus aerolatus]|nr:hypothetical protein [Xenophilus aerolatus]
MKVDDLAAGVYAVSTGDPDQPTLGRYYAGSDGKRLLALESAGETVDRILRRADGSSAWVAVPAPTADLNVQLLRSQPSATAATPAAASLAGRYVVRLSSGAAADFRIDAQGRIAAGTLSGCQLSGSLASGTLPGTLALKLESRNCAGVPASATGVLVADPSDAPAALRLLADDGKQAVDLRGYAETV